MFTIFFFFKDRLKTSQDFKNKQKSYVYSESVFNALYIEAKHKYLKNFLWTKWMVPKKLFFRIVPTHHSFTFNLWLFYEPKYIRLISLKLCVEFSIFDSISFLLKFIFLVNKMYGLFNLKTSQFLSKLK